MAKTFYKYGERDAISFVDWSKVGQNFTTMVDEELKRREDEKAAIQKGVDETMKFINDNPIGDYDVANDFSLAHAKNAQEYLLMADKLLKAGKIKPQDFVRMRENLNTGTQGIYEVAEAYQARYEQVMDDINSGDPQLSNLVYSQMESLEGIGKLKNTDAIIDTSSGRVNLTKYTVGNDGVKKYTDGYTTNELKAFLSSDIKRFNVKDASKQAADSLGGLTEQYFDEAQRAGGVHVLRQSVNRYDSSELKGVKEGYQRWLDNTVDSYMSDVQRASILVDFLQGEGYRAVTNRQDFDKDKTGKLLYIKPNGELEFQDGQEEYARETLKNQINYSIEQKYQEKTGGTKAYAPTRARRSGDSRLNANEVINMMGMLYYGNQSQIKSATDYFRDVIPNAEKVDRQRDRLIVTFTDGSSRDFDIEGRTQKEFIESATPLLSGEVDLSGALSRARFDPTQIKSDFSDSSIVVSAVQKARNFVDEIFSTAPKERLQLTREINSIYSNLGFRAEPLARGRLRIYAPNDEQGTVFNREDLQDVKEFIKGNITMEAASSASDFMSNYTANNPQGTTTVEGDIDTSGY